MEKKRKRSKRKRRKVSAISRMDRFQDRQRTRTTTMIHPLFLRSWTGLFKVSSRKFDESIERYYSVPPSQRPSSAFFNHSKRINHPSREAQQRLNHPPSFVELGRPESSLERRYQTKLFPSAPRIPRKIKKTRKRHISSNCCSFSQNSDDTDYF